MIIYAVNVNTGGGKVLLDRLMIQNPFEFTSAAFLDKRYSVPSEYKGKSFFFSKFSRLSAEQKLHAEIPSHNKNESILFFGNLPPFFKPQLKSYLYLQNCYTTGQIPLPKDSIWVFVRSLIESWILKLFYKNVSEIWVQTEWMRKLTQKQCPKAEIKVKPFLPLLPKATPKLDKIYKFIYVGSLSINKRLNVFLNALKELDSALKAPIQVSIVLNSKDEETQELLAFTHSLRNISLHIKCHLNREEIFALYESSEFLIVTTLFESLYLPIYEAIHFGCKIIAPQEAGYLSHLHTDKKFTFYRNNELRMILSKSL